MLMMRRGTFAAVTKPVIVKMSADDTGNGNKQKQDGKLSIVKLFKNKKDKAGGKDKHRNKRAVVFYKTMKQGIRTYHESQPDHTPLKKGIVNDVYAKYRKR